MRKDIRLIMDKLYLLDAEREALEKQAEEAIQEVCDFNAGLTNCSGDGYLVIDDDSANVGMLACLNGKTKANKLTLEEYEKFTI